MQSGPVTDETSALICKLGKLLDQGFKHETWLVRTQGYKNDTTEAVYQAKLTFLKSPNADNAQILKTGLGTLQSRGKSFVL